MHVQLLHACILYTLDYFSESLAVHVSIFCQCMDTEFGY